MQQHVPVPHLSKPPLLQHCPFPVRLCTMAPQLTHVANPFLSNLYALWNTVIHTFRNDLVLLFSFKTSFLLMSYQSGFTSLLFLCFFHFRGFGDHISHYCGFTQNLLLWSKWDQREYNFPQLHSVHHPGVLLKAAFQAPQGYWGTLPSEKIHHWPRKYLENQKMYVNTWNDENDNVKEKQRKRWRGKEKCEHCSKKTNADMQSVRESELWLNTGQGTGVQLNGVIWTLDEEHHFNEQPKRDLAAGADPLTRLPTEARLTQSKA